MTTVDGRDSQPVRESHMANDLLRMLRADVRAIQGATTQSGRAAQARIMAQRFADFDALMRSGHVALPSDWRGMVNL